MKFFYPVTTALILLSSRASWLGIGFGAKSLLVRIDTAVSDEDAGLQMIVNHPLVVGSANQRNYQVLLLKRGEVLESSPVLIKTE